MTERTTVVLCGSVTRAVAALNAAERHYRAQGYTVHKPVADDSRTPQEHAERWYALIDACGPDDLVVICCPPGQDLGEQTTREMDRALDGGKRVEHWRSEVPPRSTGSGEQCDHNWPSRLDCPLCGPAAILAAAAADIARSAPITLNEAVTAIRDHAATQLPPAVAGLLKRLKTMHIAGTLPVQLAVAVCDVGRELLANAKPTEPEERAS